ncbi:hypothetical protein AB1Y20_020232 [Prymnesium parvum]|uniref:DNA methylase N-4/N-6 domain-containing protein n=1 Tax=Prymnesium parvum TaxID=97485 RepID=A0AB34JUL8_PRYPA
MPCVPLPALPKPSGSLEVHLTYQGEQRLADNLGAALHAQWAFGFPTTPHGYGQLTHGFHRYPAGMQPVAAQHLLRTLSPSASTVLDPFCGSGTTLVEALRAGLAAIGADASPLAVFVAAHHSWRPTEVELHSLRDAAACVAEEAQAAQRGAALQRARCHPKRPTREAWAPLRNAIREHPFSASKEAPSPLWFCFSAALQRAERSRTDDSPAGLFTLTVEEYISALGELTAVVPSSLPPVLLVHADARTLRLDEQQGGKAVRLVDGIVTSPPYPGVYDYLSFAREERARLTGLSRDEVDDVPLMGLTVPLGRAWPEEWSSSLEMGARKTLRKSRVRGEFARTWAADQRAWMSRAREHLHPGGRAAILIGDGDALDAHASTVEAATDVGFGFVASATIMSGRERHARHRGTRRTEHAILLEAL